MIAVDTNVIVRLLTRDDEDQFQKSLALFQDQDVFIPDTVLLETEWVLRFAYHFNPNEICKAFRSLLGLPNVQVSDGSMIAQAIDWHENELDFADALHLALSQNCSRFYSVDAKFVTRAKSLTKCEVCQP
jgi:predicted nucleic-acid-binding protein